MTASAVSTAAEGEVWPALPIASWEPTFATLHMLTQIVGKTRLALAPMENHWWQVTLYVTPRGLTTSSMPYGDRVAAVDFDFIDHSVVIRTSTGASRGIPLVSRPVSDFYAEYLEVLKALGIDAKIRGVPVEIVTAIPFAEDTEHRTYDAEWANRWWRVMAQTDRVLKRFRGRFEGKASPVHFFWGSFDFAATRFSGRGAPEFSGVVPNCPDYVMKEAYSRECSSCGFWPGGDGQDAAFYSYVYPEPDGYKSSKISPPSAYYDETLREFVLTYEAMRLSPSPDDTLLTFLQTTYEAAANCAKWDRTALERTAN
ncbi:MAG: DUF5996 family protein [Gemmatimonadaceae bacterium]